MTSAFLVPREEWPFLICGPMLRRVTPDQVAVFVATSASFTAQLHVRQAGSSSSGDWKKSPSQTSVSLGGALHVLVITLTPPTALTVDLVYEYDVEFTVASSVKVCTDAGRELSRTTRPFGLSELGLLAGTRHVGLGDGALPSFAIQSSREKLRLIHASCRKPHGGGEDAMPFITELFGPNAATSAYARPHYLILTGDQIYADDVSISLLWLIQKTGTELMNNGTEPQGVTEKLTLPRKPKDPARPKLPEWPGGEVSFPGAKQWSAGKERQTLMQAFPEVSSEAKDSHLVFLAEFYAMYLLAWSPALWGSDWSADDSAKALNEYKKLAKQNKWPLGEEVSHKKVRSFAQGTSKVRRVLANVSTLMMFDDHEVSDDWNIDQTWPKDFRDGKNPLIQRIIRNALLAFAAFQAWGNDPDRFATGTAGRKLLDSANPNTPPKDNVFGTANCVDGLLRLGDFEASLSPSKKQPMLWHWGIDLPGSDYRILALDTRTRRQYNAASETALLDEAAMREQLPGPPPSGDNKITFVLSPAPVLGHPLLEEVIQPIAKKNMLGRTADAEAWSMHRECLTDLLHRLARYRQVVILSGDVHYGYSNRTDFRTLHERASASTARSAIFVQLCSSSAHNEEGKTLKIENLGTAGMDQRSWRGRRFATWQDHLVPTDASIESKIRDTPPAVGDGSGSPVKVMKQSERVLAEIVIEILGKLEAEAYKAVYSNAFLSLVAVSQAPFTSSVSGVSKIAAAKALLPQITQNIPRFMSFLYYKAQECTLPMLTEDSVDFPFTLPVGPWFSDDLRRSVGQILPAPNATDTGWAWTWTTTFLAGKPEDPLETPIVSTPFRLGLEANISTVIGRPNFGEVGLYVVDSNNRRVESLVHRINYIDATTHQRKLLDHRVLDLSPIPVTEPWAPVYS